MNALSTQPWGKQANSDGPEHLQNPEAFATYSLSCPQSPEEVEIREAIKDINHCPYIPGSTLKGAIRTALLWDLINASDEHYEKDTRYIKEIGISGNLAVTRDETHACETN